MGYGFYSCKQMQSALSFSCSIAACEHLRLVCGDFLGESQTKLTEIAIER